MVWGRCDGKRKSKTSATHSMEYDARMRAAIFSLKLESAKTIQEQAMQQYCIGSFRTRAPTRRSSEAKMASSDSGSQHPNKPPFLARAEPGACGR